VRQPGCEKMFLAFNKEILEAVGEVMTRKINNKCAAYHSFKDIK